MDVFYKVENKQNYTNIAYEKIKSAIINGELKAGDHLNVSYLAKVLGMSRTPVREALMILEKDGLAESKNIGVYVKHLSLKELYDLTDLRAVLECHALKYAIDNITEEEIKSFEERLIDLRNSSAEESEIFQISDDIDNEFHALIVEKSNNPFLINTSKSILNITLRYFRLFILNKSNENLTKAMDVRSICKAVFDNTNKSRTTAHSMPLI